jgi:hypothetical protein
MRGVAHFPAGPISFDAAAMDGKDWAAEARIRRRLANLTGSQEDTAR